MEKIQKGLFTISRVFLSRRLSCCIAILSNGRNLHKQVSGTRYSFLGHRDHFSVHRSSCISEDSLRKLLV